MRTNQLHFKANQPTIAACRFKLWPQSAKKHHFRRPQIACASSTLELPFPNPPCRSACGLPIVFYSGNSARCFTRLRHSTLSARGVVSFDAAAPRNNANAVVVIIECREELLIGTEVPSVVPL